MPGFLNRGGRRIDSPRERDLAARLEQASSENEDNPQPLAIHASPFAMDLPAYLRAAAGPPAWSRRLVRIQELEAALHEELRAAWQEYERRFHGQPELLAAAWQTHLNRVDLVAINDLIDKHNLYYPIEAGLRMQWPSGRYILPNGVEFPLPRLTVARLSARCALKR